MATPLLGQSKVDKILSQFSQRYTSEDFICDLILPVLKVKEKTGKFAKYGKENLRIFGGGLLRAPGTRAKGVNYSVAQGTYSCSERSDEKGIPWEMYANYDDPYDPKRDAVALCKDLIQQDKEYALASVLANNSVITHYTNLLTTDKWSDKVNSDPLDDLLTACGNVRSRTGRWPNLLVLSYNVMVALKFHPVIRDQVKYTPGRSTGGSITNAELVQVLGDLINVKEVLVGNAVYNSAAEGQTDVIADIWANNAWVIYRTPKPTLMEATFGMTVTDVLDVVDGYPEQQTKQDFVRATVSFDQNIMDTDFAERIGAL